LNIELANQRSSLFAWNTRVPVEGLAVFRGVGQVFFQENALTGICFLIGIALSSPVMAAGALVGSAVGTITAWLLKFDRAELAAGIYGFNATLVGIATFFFFLPGALSIGLMLVGCVVATFLTKLMRRHVPFPTYTTPFIVMTWAIFFLGLALGLSRPGPGEPIGGTNLAVAITHGVGQVMFQASVWTGRFFLIGIALSDWKHALWVLAGATLGALIAGYHVEAAARSIDPERLVERAMTENIALGLYGYNATLAAVALFLSRRSLVPPVLGILLSVPLTEAFPLLGLPALTAPFVLATWTVLAMGGLESKYLVESSSGTA
jgi:urea transporter